MNRNIILAAAALAVIAIGGYFFVNNDQSPDTAVLGETLVGQAQAATDADIDTSLVAEMALGDENAPVTLIEYVSFTCPHCQRFHEDVFPKLKADYIDTGKVRFILREVYFDGPGLWAGMVARCGGGLRYFGIVDLIFENQSKWTIGEPAQIASNLKKLGKLTGMQDATLDACLQDIDMAKALTAVFQQTTQEHGVRSTPSFVINGETMSNMSYEELQKAIEDEL